MKKTLTAFALVLFTAATASAGPINFGFETGTTAGWTETLNGGTATVVVSSAPGPGEVGSYLPPEGNYFLKLKSGATGVNQWVSQFFTMAAGETLYGEAAWVGNDYLPYNDNAYVEVVGTNGAIVWSKSIGGAGDYVNTPWQTWSFTNTSVSNQNYAVIYSVANVGDSALDSYGLFDAHVPDGGSALALLGLGMIGLSTIRRKLF